MKRKHFFSRLLIVMIISSLSLQCFAGHWEYLEKKFGMKRLRAYAHLTCPYTGYGPSQFNAGYYSAGAQVTYGNDNCALWLGGTSEATAVIIMIWGMRTPWMRGTVRVTPPIVGGSFSELAKEMLPEPASPPPPVPVVPDSQVISLVPDMDDTTKVVLDSISIHLSSDSTSPLKNIYTISIWKPVDSTDTVATPATTIAYGSVYILNGAVVTSGIFSPGDFTVSRTSGRVTVNYTGSDKTITLPAGSHDNIAIAGQGDIITDEKAAMHRMMTASATEEIKGNTIDIYPNPVSDKLSVALHFRKEGNIQLKIFTTDGKLIQEQWTQFTTAEQTQLTEVNLGQLPAGQYYILAIQDDVKVLKPFIKK